MNPEFLKFDWWSFFKGTAAIFFLISVAGVFCLMLMEWVFWPFWLKPIFNKWMEEE